MITKTMFKHTNKIRNITCLICFLLLVYGCTDKKNEPQQPKKVVSKKIAVQPQAGTGVTETSAPVAAAPAVKPEAKESTGTGDDLSIPAAPDLVQDNILAKAATGYDPKGKIDPFIPLIKEEKAEKSGALAAAKKTERKKRKPATPLERIDLGQLNLTAIVRSAQGNKALVEESSGKGYIITKGTFIGVNQGTVIDVQKDRVIVEEEVENLHGEITLKTRELRLPKPSGEE